MITDPVGCAAVTRALTLHREGVTAGEVAVTYGLDREAAAATLDGLTELGACQVDDGRYILVPGEDLPVALAVLAAHYQTDETPRLAEGAL